jgi:hypothetical protein
LQFFVVRVNQGFDGGAIDAAPRSLQRADEGGPLRQFDPDSVGVADHGDPGRRTQRPGGHGFADAGGQHLGVGLSDLEDLEGDVAPARAVEAGVEGRVRILLQDQAGASGREEGGAWVWRGLSGKSERRRAEGPVDGQVPDPEANAQLAQALFPRGP